MLSMVRIHTLLSESSVAAQVELTLRVYTLTSSGFRNVSLFDKIRAVTGLTEGSFKLPTLTLPINSTAINLA